MSTDRIYTMMSVQRIYSHKNKTKLLINTWTYGAAVLAGRYWCHIWLESVVHLSSVLSTFVWNYFFLPCLMWFFRWKRRRRLIWTCSMNRKVKVPQKNTRGTRKVTNDVVGTDDIIKATCDTDSSNETHYRTDNQGRRAHFNVIFFFNFTFTWWVSVGLTLSIKNIWF